MTKQQIIQRLDLIKAEIMFPNCHDDLPPAHRLGRVGQQLEDLIGDIELDEPIRINSGYRTPEHNAQVGRAEHSQHLHGNAEAPHKTHNGTTP